MTKSQHYRSFNIQPSNISLSAWAVAIQNHKNRFLRKPLHCSSVAKGSAITLKSSKIKSIKKSLLLNLNLSQGSMPTLTNEIKFKNCLLQSESLMDSSILQVSFALFQSILCSWNTQPALAVLPVISAKISTINPKLNPGNIKFIQSCTQLKKCP